MDDTLKKFHTLCYHDIGFFAKEFLPHLLTHTPPPFHLEMYQELRKKERLVIAAPRGFAKSTISSVIYPIWLACYKVRSEIAIISASETLAVDLVRKIKREFETNQKLIKFFGPMETEKWSESHIITRNLVSIRARGAEGQIRGFRPDCLILDDIETDESVESEERRRKLKEWFYKACLNTMAVGGQLVIVGTIIHPLSLLQDILTNQKTWERRKYQAYEDGQQVEGKELWKELWPHRKLQERKAEIGSFAFSSEYLNNPLFNETAPIKKENIRYWTELPAQYSCAIAVDPAYSDDATADYKVACLVAIDQSHNRYLIHYIRTHDSMGTYIDSILNLWLSNRNTVTGVGLPNAGVEKSFYEAFMKRAEERQLYPPVMEVKNVFTSGTGRSKKDKHSRVTAYLQPLFEQGKYYISQNHIEAEDELLTYMSSKHDDLVDCMAYAEQVLQPQFYMEQEENSFIQDSKRKIPSNYGME